MRNRRWGRLIGPVRVRTTVAATLVVAATLSIGGAFLLDRFKVSLENNRRNAAISQATAIASQTSSGHVPAVLYLPNENAIFAQVVDDRGRVISASGNIGGEPPVGLPVVPGSGLVVRMVRDVPVGDGSPVGLVALSTRLSGRPVTVFTAFSVQTSDLAVHEAEIGLFLGLPLVVVIVAATTWVTVGRALRPIDSLRREVAVITSTDLHRRVPEPHTADEVARLAKTMNSMLDRLEVSVQRQRAFVADASHELRSPLTSLRAHLEIGLAGVPDTDWPATAADALAEEARIEHLVGDLLLLARLDNRDSAIGGATVDITSTVTADLESRPRVGSVTLRAVANGPAPVVMSADLARRVVTNLVDNAVRHAACEVVVTIAAREAGWVELVVHDDGPGIPKADRERVFERFVRLDDARNPGDGGTGLGLAIVREVVIRHGGSIAFTDSISGARVVARLRSAPLDLPSPAADTPPAGRDRGRWGATPSHEPPDLR